MKKLLCELCGGNDFTKGDDGLFMCGYCRTKYTPAQAQSMMIEGTVRVDRSRESDNLVTLATNALDSNNHREAFDFATRALEIDPKNSVAWYVKGDAAGWLSDLKSLRIVEMVNAFKASFEFAATEERDDLHKKCAGVLNAVGVACSNISLQHSQKFASVEGTWEEHVARCQQIISAFKISYAWHPIRQPLDNIVTVASNLIIGATYKYWDSTWNAERTGVRQLSEAEKQGMQELIESTAKEIQKIDPAFVAPKPKTQTGCFVVTATMGSERSLPVVALREFRDVVLADYAIGRRFIKWYYALGPIVADYIEPSRVLRLISLALVVAPSTAVALLALKVKRITR